MYSWKLIFIGGVSGAGKNTVIHEMLQTDLGLKEIISCKTRKLRPGEVNGVNYHYYTPEQFQQAIDAGEFLEYQQNYGLDWYATRKADVIEALEKWEHVIKDIDIKWMMSIEEHHPDIRAVTRSIFIDIDDATMRQRITDRSPVSEDEMQKRVATAKMERGLAQHHCTDVVNGVGTREEVAQRVYTLLHGYLSS